MLRQGRDVRKWAGVPMVLNPDLYLGHMALQAGLKWVISPVLEGSSFLELRLKKNRQT